ncbi:MAG: leader peptidase (prepilin peptidase)/N-methyltransferase, partial [Candidatus Azotimanducaceae bacterium]
CAECQATVSARYPIVELATALLAVLVVHVMGVTPAAAAALILTFGLMTLALIDYDTQLLPDDITLPFLWLGLIVNSFGIMTGFTNAFIGAIAGYLVLWSVFQAFKLITGKEGMGYGDFKMLAMLGAWLGIEAVPLIIVLSSFAGAIIGLALIAFGRDKTKPIKFGPFLAVAGFVALLWGDVIINRYLLFAT